MEEGRDMQAEYKTPVLGGGPETSSFPALSSVMAASGTTWDLGVHRAWWKAWCPQGLVESLGTESSADVGLVHHDGK